MQQLAVCIRQAENGYEGYTWGYPVGTGDGGGAYQFEEATWMTANRLDGGNPYTHSSVNQDNAFLAIYEAYGVSPWEGTPCIQ